MKLNARKRVSSTSFDIGSTPITSTISALPCGGVKASRMMRAAYAACRPPHNCLKRVQPKNAKTSNGKVFAMRFGTVANRMVAAA
jgi:hypothetical protein